jgi:hypothetical protein
VLQVSKNPLGLTDVPVFVDARPHTWMLDPTAPFNLISRSLAKEAGMKVSEEASTIHTLTGRPIQVHVTVIPRFTVGGRLTLRNMTAFVYEDADYFFPKAHYQVEGVLGYPALAALGSLTITANATIEVRPVTQIQPPAKDDRLTSGARFFLDGDRVIVALGNAGNAGEGAGAAGANAEAQGAGQNAGQGTSQERMFAVDAGGQQTYLTSRYYDEHAADFAGQKMALFFLPGSQNLAPQPAYVAETIRLTVGPTTVEVHYVQVLTQPVGSAVFDDVYGVLGIDALDQLKSYTFDYRTMRFGVRAVLGAFGVRGQGIGIRRRSLSGCNCPMPVIADYSSLTLTLTLTLANDHCSLPPIQTKRKLSATAASRIAAARASGRFHQAVGTRFGLGVREWTRPANSGSGRGSVKKLTSKVRIRFAAKADAAVAKHCAKLLG